MNKDTKIAILAIIAMSLVLVAAWITLSYFEADAYNRITGKNVSTFDAMFLELRIQEGANQK